MMQNIHARLQHQTSRDIALGSPRTASCMRATASAQGGVGGRRCLDPGAGEQTFRLRVSAVSAGWEGQIVELEL